MWEELESCSKGEMGRRAWGNVIHLPWSPNSSVPTLLLKFAPHRGTLLIICHFTAQWVLNYFPTIWVFAERWLSSTFVSGNHRRVGVNRDLQRSSSPTFLLKQTAQVHVWVGFECPWRRKLHSLSGLPVSVLCHPQSKQVFFLILRWNVLCFSLCLLPLVLLGTTEISQVLTSWHLLLRSLCALKWHWIKLSILKAKA